MITLSILDFMLRKEFLAANEISKLLVSPFAVASVSSVLRAFMSKAKSFRNLDWY